MGRILDATAAVAFTIGLVFAAGQSMGVGGAIKSLAIVIIGSLICGAVVAGIALLLAGGLVAYARESA